MQTIVLYRYIREDGGVTTSPIKPDCDYTEKVRLVADEGKRLVLPDGTYALCADLETADGVTEEDDPDYGKDEEHGKWNRCSVASITDRCFA